MGKNDIESLKRPSLPSSGGQPGRDESSCLFDSLSPRPAKTSSAFSNSRFFHRRFSSLMQTMSNRPFVHSLYAHSHSYTYSLPDRAYHPRRRSKSSSSFTSKIGTSALPRRISSDSEKKPEPTYDILPQLKKTPAHISLWDLLHSSSKHSDCLLKFLQEVHVSKEVEPEMLDTMINLMKAPKVLSF